MVPTVKVKQMIADGCSIDQILSFVSEC